MSGLLCNNDVNTNSNPNSSYFIRKDQPVIVDTLIADNIITEEIDLNGNLLTTTGNTLTLDGVPVGGGIVNTISGTSPITITGTNTDPIINLADSSVTPSTYSFATITVDSKGLITSASSGTVPANDDWSNFPAQNNVNMNNSTLTSLSAPINTTDATTKIYVDTLDTQNVKLSGNQTITGIKTFNTLPETSINPTSNNQFVNKSYVDTLDTQNVKLSGNQTITGIKTFNTLPESSVNPTTNNQFVNKSYVDNLPVPAFSTILTASNSAGSNEINMNNNKIINCLNPTNQQDVATKNYVDNIPIPPLSTILNSGNIANQDINMAGFDLANVNDITMSGLLPTITATNILGNLAIGSAATMSLGTVGLLTIASGGILSLGGGSYTTLENLKIDNSVITKDGSVPDLSINNVSSITNTTAVLNLSGNPGIKPNAILDKNDTVGATGTILTSTGSQIEWIPRHTTETLTSPGTISATTDISLLESAGSYTLPNGLFNGQRKMISNTSLTPVSQTNAFDPLTGSFNDTSVIRAVAYDSVNNWLYVSGDFFTGLNNSRHNKLLAFDLTNQTISNFQGIAGPNVGSIDALLLDGSNLYVGGSFTVIPNVTNTARFSIFQITGFGTGSFVSPTGTSAQPGNGSVLAIAKYGNLIAIGGTFTGVTGISNTSRIAFYDPATSTYSSVGGGVGTGTGITQVPSQVRALFVDGTRMYIGGSFNGLSGGIGGGTNSIGYWDGTNFIAMGQGHESSPVNTICKFGNDIIIGGDFDGGFRNSNFARQPGARIIKWNISTEQYSPIGQGFGNSVQRVYIRPSTGQLMAVGLFTEDGLRKGGFQRIAVYDDVNDIWNPFGGVDGPVFDVTEINGNDILVVGGFANGFGAIGDFGYTCGQIIHPSNFMFINGSFSGVNGNKDTIQFTGANGNAVNTLECVWNSVNNKWMITNDGNFLTR